MRTLLGLFVKKILLFHGTAPFRVHLAVKKLGKTLSEPEYCIIATAASGERVRAGATFEKAKKSVFSSVKAVKQIARDRLGSPPPERVIPDPKQKAAAKPKHKQTLADLLAKDPDTRSNQID